MKSKFLAGILGIIGGSFGLHLFYLNRPKKAWLYVCFFYTLLPAIFGLIGGIRLITMTDKSFQKKYCEKNLTDR